MDNFIKEIYLAGGCFWGIEAYFSIVDGVVETVVGYANGKTQNPTYHDVCTGKTGFSETVLIKYDENKINLEALLKHFFYIIDPTAINRQGHDVGTQYRSGIYYNDEADILVIQKCIESESLKYKEPIVTEILRLENFYPAEEYHQKYLDKNPGGYCHIDLSKIYKVD